MSNMIFREGRYEFDFLHSVNAFRADKDQYNGLSAVDFIVKMDDKFLFIEVKDPEHPSSLKFGNPDEFIEEIKKPAKVAGKFKDSLLRELAKGQSFLTPVLNVLILEWSKFDAAQRRKMQEDIGNVIPKFEEDCFSSVKNTSFVVLNINDFQKIFPMFKISQLPLHNTETEAKP